MTAQQQPYPLGVKLGVDVGMVRVGLACCDAHGILAIPVRTLRRDLKKGSDLAIVMDEALQRGVVQIFVGLPRSLKGEEGASAGMARDYAQALVKRLDRAGLYVPVHLIDERLTTVTAHQQLREAGISSRNHRKVVDQVAAVSILQQAIDMQKSLHRDVGARATVTGSIRSRRAGDGADTAHRGPGARVADGNAQIASPDAANPETVDTGAANPETVEDGTAAPGACDQHRPEQDTAEEPDIPMQPKRDGRAGQ